MDNQSGKHLIFVHRFSLKYNYYRYSSYIWWEDCENAVKKDWMTKRFVWHGESGTGSYEQNYWIATMKSAYRAKWEASCYYHIKNPKAIRALTCSFCKAHPVAACYDRLELYCTEHVPVIEKPKDEIAAMLFAHEKRF